MRSNKFFLLLLSIVASAVCHARTDGDNHVLVREMLDTAGCDFRESVRYYDGIGRPTLTLESRGGGAYAATLSEYDLSGRVVGEWLPAPVGSPSLPLPSATTDGLRDDRFTAYTFSGKPSRALHEHSRSRSLTSLSEETFYTYQPSTGRLLRTEHSVNGSPRTLLSAHAYDGAGRLVSSRSGGLSPVQYRYNLRSWLTAITGPGFSETLRYTDGDRPQYGGNPSAMVWCASGDAQPRMYSYEYDSLDRLVAARYGGSAGGDYSTSYTYDAMGNVLSLTRRGLLSDGVYGCIDRLRYSYEGNRVIKIDDAVGADDGPSFNGAFHFVDGADAAVEYTYDENGNMMSDLNRGISRIDYNCLNLPQTVAFSSTFGYSRTIAYGYTTDGEKTSATYITSTDLKPWRPSLPQQPSSSSSIAVSPPIHVTPLSLSSRTNYCGNITYENDTVSRVLVDGGYITFGRSAGGQLSSPSYHFYVKDHLGNNRAVVSSSGRVEETNSYYPFGGLMAVNVGARSVQPYKYIGKELDRMFGWNMLDHGARWYDTAICRWWSMDEMCEKQYCYNPFCNCMDNPVRHIDKDGKLPGDSFDSPDDAATNFGMIYNFWSIKEDKEISSYIYSYNDENGNTKYSYNVPVLGSESSVLPRIDFPKKGKIYGAVHTHARYDEHSENAHYGNRFSGDDLNSAA